MSPTVMEKDCEPAYMLLWRAWVGGAEHGGGWQTPGGGYGFPMAGFGQDMATDVCPCTEL